MYVGIQILPTLIRYSAEKGMDPTNPSNDSRKKMNFTYVPPANLNCVLGIDN